MPASPGRQSADHIIISPVNLFQGTQGARFGKLESWAFDPEMKRLLIFRLLAIRRPETSPASSNSLKFTEHALNFT